MQQIWDSSADLGEHDSDPSAGELFWPDTSYFGAQVDVDAYRAAVVAGNDEPIPQALAIDVRPPPAVEAHARAGAGGVVERFLARLYRDSALRGALYDPDRPVRRLTLGDGLAGRLSDGQLEWLIEALGRHFTLTRDVAREHCAIVDVGAADAQRIGRLADIGFNRLTLELDLASVHTLEDPTRRAMDAARRWGFAGIELRLSPGLADGDGSWLTAVDTAMDWALGLAPERLALRWSADDTVPVAQRRAEAWRRVLARVAEAEYRCVGPGHFARADDRLASAHGRGSVELTCEGTVPGPPCDWIGLGVGAISRAGRLFAQNTRQPRLYHDMLAQGQLPIERGLAMDEAEQSREAAIEHLLVHGSVDLADLGITGDEPMALPAELRAAVSSTADGAMVIDGRHLRLTRRGQPRSAEIAQLVRGVVHRAALRD